MKYIRWTTKTFQNIRNGLPYPPDKILKKLNINDQPDIDLQEVEAAEKREKKRLIDVESTGESSIPVPFVPNGYHQYVLDSRLKNRNLAFNT